MNSIEPSSLEPLAGASASTYSLTSFIFSFVILGILLLCSALISGSEAAYFSLSPAEKEALKSDKSKSALLTLNLINIPKQLLATILITNNFVNVAIVILSSSILAEIVQLSPNLNGSETIRFIIEVFAITFLLLLIGEVIPKIYANKNAMKFAKFMARPLTILNTTPPLSWFKAGLVNGSNFINRHAKKKGIKISSDELEQALALTKEENTSEGEHKILEGIVKFGNTDTRQIMRSRMDIIALDQEADFQTVLDLILESGYSRIPVYKDSFDNVTGILFIKDLLPHLKKNNKFHWQELTRKPFFVPENKKIDDLLKEFQEKKVHMAVVVDEYGGASGLVTLEDVLEEIVGDITDEFDEEEVTYTKIDERTYQFEGKTALIDFYKILDIDGKEFENQKGESDTLGGFIVENVGRILKNNEFITCNNIKLIVESSDKRRIKLVKAHILESEEN